MRIERWMESSDYTISLNRVILGVFGRTMRAVKTLLISHHSEENPFRYVIPTTSFHFSPIAITWILSSGRDSNSFSSRLSNKKCRPIVDRAFCGKTGFNPLRSVIPTGNHANKANISFRNVLSFFVFSTWSELRFVPWKKPSILCLAFGAERRGQLSNSFYEDLKALDELNSELNQASQTFQKCKNHRRWLDKFFLFAELELHSLNSHCIQYC